MELKNKMTEIEMQQYANETLGYGVEFLFEYATRELGYEPEVIEVNGKEEYLFTKQ
jgi:hypothetical protein